MMTEQLEQRVRRALVAVDVAEVGSSAGVLQRGQARLHRRDRRRRVALGCVAIGIVAAGVAGLATFTGRDATPRTGVAHTDVEVPSSPSVDSTSAPTSSPTQAPVTEIIDESRWRPISAHPDGVGWDVAAVWMGDRAFVLGSRAYSYDPSRDTWVALAPFPAHWTPVDSCQGTPATCIGNPIGESPDGYANVSPIVVWTGDKVLVIGGDRPVTDEAGPAPGCEGPACSPNLTKSSTVGYVPATDSWQLLASPPWFVNERSPHVWTGTELLVWPWDIDDNPDPAYAYDPAANTWRQLADVPIAPRQNAASAWTGTEWIVWGGGDDSQEFADGAAYHPTTDSWRVLAPAPIAARKAQGTWTGAELLVMAGSQGGGTSVCCGTAALSDGAAYDPATDTWRSLAGTVGHPGFEPLWAGDVLLLFAKGGVIVYDPTTERYIDVCCDGMAGSAHIWTGAEVISFGSYTADRGGGIFTPP